MNYVLIGMPTSGKSTVGVMLAKEICFDFLDTDILLQRREKKMIQKILDEDGLESFYNIEEQALLSVDVDETVISTGGSAVYSAAGMEHICRNATVIYLELPLEEVYGRIENLKSRGIAGLSHMHFSKIYLERKALYEKYAHITVNASGLSKDELLKKILKIISK
ncbi:MAG: shikimate kinase [Clostridia bacterium]|nr:shikimate kinase [Clostridia bacterium]